MSLCPACMSANYTVEFDEELGQDCRCNVCGTTFYIEYDYDDDDYDDDDYEPECEHCHGLGGNIYDDRVTPCPVCKK